MDDVMMFGEVHDGPRFNERAEWCHRCRHWHSWHWNCTTHRWRGYKLKKAVAGAHRAVAGNECERREREEVGDEKA